MRRPGRVLSVAGNAETVTFVRSAPEAISGPGVTTTGTLERYNLTDRDLAIICSSHKGTIEQVRRCLTSCGELILTLLHPVSIPEGKAVRCNTIALVNTRGCWLSVSNGIGL